MQNNLAESTPKVEQLQSDLILQRLSSLAENLTSIKERLYRHKEHLYGPIPQRDDNKIEGPSNCFMEKTTQGFNYCDERLKQIFDIVSEIERF